MNHYKLTKDDAEVLTKYYVLDHVLCIREDRKAECSVSYVQGTYPDTATGMELVAVNQFELSPMCFTLNHNFHHERQTILIRTELEENIALELEILVNGIKDPKERRKELAAILDLIDCKDLEPDDPESESEDNPIISLSYNLVASYHKYKEALKYLRTLESISVQ